MVRVLCACGVVGATRRWFRPAGLAMAGVAVGGTLAVAGCTRSGQPAGVPELARRGTTMTTVKPTRQDLTNTVSLSGKVTMDPVYGVVAPVGGQVRFADVKPATSTPTRATLVANVWAGGKAYRVEVPAGSVFTSRLVADRSTVTAGMPIMSATLAGYGIVADVDAAQAYRLSDAPTSITGQISGGPGPFACHPTGTIAALPAGIVPQQPAGADPAGGNAAGVTASPGPAAAAVKGDSAGGGAPSAPTGLRVVCTPPVDVKMINGAAATLEVVTARAVNVLVLPVEAVAGQSGSGKVDVVLPDRTRQTRDVVLGLTDGRVIEIRSGLTGDETVAVPGPDLAGAGPGGQASPGGPGMPVPVK